MRQKRGKDRKQIGRNSYRGMLKVCCIAMRGERRLWARRPTKPVTVRIRIGGEADLGGGRGVTKEGITQVTGRVD